MSGPGLPAHPEAETAVIAALFMGEDAMATASTMLVEASFTDRRHRLIWRAAQALGETGAALDPLTVATELARTGDLEAAGGKDYLGYLIDAVPTAANVEYHAKIVKEHAERRALIQTAQRLEAEARRGTLTASAIAASASAELVTVAADTGAKGFQPISDFVWPVMHQLEDRAAGRAPAGVATGYRAIDEQAGGFRPGDLVFLAGVPSSGKTALALNILLNAAQAGVECAMVSAEMGSMSLTERCLSNLARVDSLSMRRGLFANDDYGRIAAAAGFINRMPLYLDDTARPNIRDILAKLRHLKTLHPTLALVAVDFIQLVERDGDDAMALALTKISYDLKGIAKELGLAMIATCQVDAQAAERSEKGPRPRLHHLRWSQAMREAGDLIGLVFRPGMYDEGVSDSRLEVTWEKARDLPRFVSRLRWLGSYMRVEDVPDAAPLPRSLERGTNAA